MNLSKKFAVVLGLCLISVGAFADAMDFLKDKIYVSVGGGYIKSRDFKGGTATAAVGYRFDKHNNVELQVRGVWEDATGSASYSKETAFPNAESLTGNLRFIVGSGSATQKVKIDRYSILCNYRFLYEFEGTGLSVYAGAGIGVSFIDVKRTFNLTVTPDGSNPANFGLAQTIYYPTREKTGHPIRFAAQVFAGAGYDITEQLTLSVGLTLLNSKNKTFGGRYINVSTNPTTAFTTPSVTLTSIQWIIEGALTYRF